MPRRSSIRYFTSRGGYYTQFQKRQYPLAQGPDDYPDGPTYKAARQAFDAIFEAEAAPSKGEQNPVRVICNMFLTWAESRIRPTTMKAWQHCLAPFMRQLGDTSVGSLSRMKIEAFLAHQRLPRRCQQKQGGKVFERKWGDSSCDLFVRVLKRILSWSVKQGILEKNPLSHLEAGPSRSRGRKCILTPAIHQQILALSKHETLRHLCVILEATGARPSEIVAAETRYWSEKRQALHYPSDATRRPDEFRHKTAKYKDRYIYFSGEALALIRALMERYPKGPLFRTSRGTPYSVTNLNKRFEVLADKTGIPDLTPYAYRHTFATRWLERGESIEILAELLGNSPEVIRKHYSHLCEQYDTLRSRLEAFRKNSYTASAEPAPPSQAGQAQSESPPGTAEGPTP